MKYTQTSYSVSRCIIILITIILAGKNIPSYAQDGADFSSIKGYTILPGDEDSKSDNKWAEYMTNQSINRTKKTGIINNKETIGNNNLTIYVHIDNTVPYDYSVITAKNKMTISASSESNMLWLVYQVISKISETDKRWNSEDLDPAIITLDNARKKFDFGYRSIYSSAMSDIDKINISADQHVDYSWGLWGHNLRKVFYGEKIPSDAMATVNGKKTDRQFCFSSDILYKAIHDYIIDSYGDGKDGYTGWFAIIPNDNMDVCMCNKCKEAGNTATSATPAVTSMITRLANEFKNHKFYTSAYNTTKTAPKKKLPENAGVIVSAIDLPLNYKDTSSSEYSKWRNSLHEWQLVTDKIIVWDYMRNFDDYLTPFPCLYSIQNRLKWFKSLGIYGVFYNGSGDDYSTFDDLQTYVISSLLKDTDTDIKKLVISYLEKHYPKSNGVISDYYLNIEDIVRRYNISLEWYSGIDFALKTYLDAGQFDTFYNELDRISKQTNDEERGRLNMLLTALNFTKLEIIRSGHYGNNNPENKKSKEYIALLEGANHFKNMNKYKEAHGSIYDYIKEWNSIDYHDDKKTCNITAENIKDHEKLTDGYYGFPHDYHLHWLIMSNKKNEIRINVHDKGGKAELSIKFLNAPQWKISTPSKVEVYQDNKLKASWAPDDEVSAESSIIKSNVSLTLEQGNNELTIVIWSGKHPKTACDEIDIHNIN